MNMIKDLFKLDDIDLKIISLLQKNTEITAAKIGRVVNRTQPSVGTRIRKIKAKGFKTMFGVDFSKIDIIMAQINIQTSDTYKITEKINGNINKIIVWTSTGKYNLNMLVCGKSIKEIERVIYILSKDETSIKSIKFEIVYNLLTDFVLPLNI